MLRTSSRKFVGQDREVRFLQPGGSEDVDHAVRRHRMFHELLHRRVHVMPAPVPRR